MGFWQEKNRSLYHVKCPILLFTHQLSTVAALIFPGLLLLLLLLLPLLQLPLFLLLLLLPPLLLSAALTPLKISLGGTSSDALEALTSGCVASSLVSAIPALTSSTLPSSSLLASSGERLALLFREFRRLKKNTNVKKAYLNYANHALSCIFNSWL